MGLINLDTVPLDLLIHILRYLDPMDILVARKTCKTLHHATSLRVVWIEALQQICNEDSIFLPSFPLTEMSTLELENVATGPQRWLLKASNHEPSEATPEVKPFAARILRPPEEINISNFNGTPGVFRALYLVPGGRFLVTFSWNYIAVWDLGLRPNSDIARNFQPISIAPTRFHSMYLVHPTPDGLGLRILTVGHLYDSDEDSDSDSDYGSIYTIFEIYPLNESPELSKIAELGITAFPETHFVSLSEDRLIFLHGNILKIWEYQTNGWASIQVELGFTQVIVSETAIILLRDIGISVWAFPPLSRTEPLFSNTSATLTPPLVSVYYSELIDPESDGVEGPCDWYSGTSQRLLYDLTKETFSESDNLQRYEVIVNGDLTDASLVHLSTIPVMNPGVSDMLYEPYRFCKGALVTWWFDYSSYEVNAHIASVPSPRLVDQEEKEVPVGKTITLYKGRHANQGSSFCPLSGRLACLDDFQYAVILDYLSYPTQPSDVLPTSQASVHSRNLTAGVYFEPYHPDSEESLDPTFG